MLNPKDLVRLRHMLETARKAVNFSQGRKRADLDQDELFSLAMVRLVEVIGEAANGISHETKQQLPQIPWIQISGTRNRLIHGYFDVDLDIVWNILSRDIPQLIPPIEAFLAYQ